jgi:chromosome segregation protein
MQFTRLRLIGFKSFVEPSDFQIEPGLTGVVGPNGCGKSNLVEALRFVMGEMSHKAMRAKELDEVIFAGTTNRPMRNHAEVVLFIDNSDRGAPAAFNDTDMLEVSRRIEREMGSAYRINGREVRARDVQLLFADASSGSRSPALVRQGQIGEIVNAKPESRRRILEEAAGISGLHARRHEAETRLKAAEHNLDRLQDVIGQIASQIDGLRRQARQAARYKKVSAQVRHYQSMLIALRWRDAEAAVIEAERTVEAATRTVAEHTRVQSEATRAQIEAAEALGPLRDAEAACAAALQRLNHARTELDREEARAKARTEDLDRRLVQLAQDLERERALATDATASIARLEDEERSLAGAPETDAASEAAARERLAAAQTAVAASEQASDRVTAALADLSAQRGQLEGALRELDQRIARLNDEIGELERDEFAIDAARNGSIDELGAAVGAAQERVAAADANALRAEATRSSFAQELEAARRPLADAERRLHRLEAEARTLAKLLDVAARSLWPPVLDTIKVEPGYEAALGAALGDDLDAPTDSASPMHWAGADPQAGDPPLPAGVEALSAHVHAPAALARRLAQIGLVARADGARVQRELAPGQRVVSKEGDLWRWDGFTVGADAATGAARRLAGRNHLAELERDIETARADVRERAALVEKAESDLRAAETAEADARTAWRAAQIALESAREALLLAERGAADQVARKSAIVEARTRLIGSREEAQAKRTETEAARAALPDLVTREAELNELRGALGEHRSALAVARAEVEGIERERAARAQRLAAVASELAAWRERAEGARLRIDALEQRLADTRTERAGLDEAPAAFARQRAALMDEIAAAEARRRAAADRLAEGEAKLTDAERAVRECLDALAAAREEAARSGARLESARDKRADLAREIAEATGSAPDAQRVAELLKEDGETLDVPAVEARLQRYEAERERLGAVNLRAEEELKEIETQHDGLVTERDDLVEAIKRLRQGISSLDREARERLTASFEVVNEHFKKLFTTLFGGGVAQLVLTDSEDPLEAGLDIVARPPGKKSQTLSLLSGGEQALTALALIFAVFLTNPAPICVLDEVDAPLDDANVERFCNLLDEMIQMTNTRFLVVTHNPITMSRMNRLYGVTMAERGVSQLVSVDLDTAQQFRAA